METIKEINEYCRIAGITRGKAEERATFIIGAIKRVLDEDKEIINKMKKDKVQK